MNRHENDGRPIDPHRINTIVFDAFGTLAAIGKQHHPYRRLFEMARERGRRPRPDDAVQVMTRNCGLREIAKWLGLSLAETEIIGIERALAAELPTIQLFPDVAPTLAGLRAKGFRLGVCSNLAAPYAPQLMDLLPLPLDGYIWSFEVGAAKPAPEIYEAVCDTLQTRPAEILFIGDAHEADCAAPRRIGMQALHLARNGNSPDSSPIRTLRELLELIQPGPET